MAQSDVNKYDRYITSGFWIIEYLIKFFNCFVFNKYISRALKDIKQIDTANSDVF